MSVLNNPIVYKNKDDYTEEEIVQIAMSLIGHTFLELAPTVTKNQKNKGLNGIVIEQFGFDYNPNSDSEPDFSGAGVELKVTPWMHNKNKTKSAKERLVLNIINYVKEAPSTFKTSSFWHKNKKLEIIWYCDDRKDKRDSRLNCKITDVLLYKYPDEDLKIIMDDWNIIHKKILSGKAHELSEADTMYLGACTKGAGGGNYRPQPFSNIQAKQRAYCLKQSYMTQLVNKYVGKSKPLERLFTIIEPKYTFEEKVIHTIGNYVGHTVDELKTIFGITSAAKNINNILLSRMFGIQGKISDTDEFKKANIDVKTIRVEQNGRIKESMSFPAFKYFDVALTDFEDSEFYDMLTQTKYLFVVFKDFGSGYVLNNAFFWNVPYPIIDNDAREVYDKTKEIILSGNIIREIKHGKRYNNFPGLSENKYCHVRPHGKDSTDTYELPVSDKLTGLSEYTKHCFWLNNTYIKEIVDNKGKDIKGGN